MNKYCLLNIGKICCIAGAHIDSVSLSVVEHTCDFGVIVSSDLSCSVHIADIVAKAHKRACVISRAFTSRDIHPLMSCLFGRCPSDS